MVKGKQEKAGSHGLNKKKQKKARGHGLDQGNGKAGCHGLDKGDHENVGGLRLNNGALWKAGGSSLN